MEIQPLQVGNLSNRELQRQVKRTFDQDWRHQEAWFKVRLFMAYSAVVLMWLTGRVPLVAALVILARDLVLVLGYKLVAPSGYQLEVSFLGKLATWILYAALGFVLVTNEGTDWPLVLLWIGIALAIAAAAQYVLRARAVLGRS